MNIDVTEIIALFAQLAGPAFSVAFVFGFGAKLVPIDKNECTNLAPNPKTKATEKAGPASCANNAIISVTSIFIVVISSKTVGHIYLHSRAKPLRMCHRVDRVRASESNGKS